MKLNWKQIRHKFDAWCDRRAKADVCNKCNRSTNDFPDWEEQWSQIKRLVNTELRNAARREE